jgi:hypothetical protein
MQIIRGIVMLIGIGIILAGLYLLVLGIGAPIEIKTIEVGYLKASLAGIGAGAGAVLAGTVVLWLPMRFMKRTHTIRTETEFDPSGILKTIQETTTTQLGKIGW